MKAPTTAHGRGLQDERANLCKGLIKRVVATSREGAPQPSTRDAPRTAAALGARAKLPNKPTCAIQHTSERLGFFSVNGVTVTTAALT